MIRPEADLSSMSRPEVDLPLGRFTGLHSSYGLIAFIIYYLKHPSRDDVPCTPLRCLS